jgi:hypothetical protein
LELLPVQRKSAELVSCAEVAELADARGSGPRLRHQTFKINYLQNLLLFAAFHWKPLETAGNQWK